ncbi:MAG: hypothetical protein HOA30_04250 [Rhodospirillaceae bacterium]|nr:hypothetical protein [Rhodospirillaceae bacterium]
MLDDLTVLQTSGNQDMNAVAQTTADEAMAFGDVIDPNQLATIHQGGGGRVDLPEIDTSNTMADVGLATGAFARRDTRVEAVDDTVIEEATRQPFSKRVGDENIAGEPNVTTATSPTRTIDADLVRDRSSGTARRVEETTRGAEREFVDEFTVDAPTNEGVPTTVKEIEPVVAAETAATTEIYEDAVISGELASQEENPASIEADETEFENDEDVTGSEETDVAADEASDDTNTEANPEPGVRLNGSRGDDVLSGGNGNDCLKGRRGDDELNGHGGNDVLKGGHGDDAVNGGDGEDQLIGGRGDDVMYGGAGDDVMRGGRGDDMFIFDDADLDDSAWHDRIDGGRGDDTLDLSGAGAGWSVHLDDGSVIEPTSPSDGGLEEPHGFSGVVEFDGGGRIEFDNIETLSW